MTVKVTSTKWEDYTEEEKQWFADDSAKTKIADANGKIIVEPKKEEPKKEEESE